MSRELVEMEIDDRPSIFRRMALRMNEFRKKGELVDFTLINHLGDEVKGHMIVMAVSCPTIKNMAGSLDAKRTFLLRDVSAEAMEQLVNFMYIGELEITANTVNCILSGAEQLGINSIEIVCLDFMRALENIENQIIPSKRYFG